MSLRKEFERACGEVEADFEEKEYFVSCEKKIGVINCEKEAGDLKNCRVAPSPRKIDMGKISEPSEIYTKHGDLFVATDRDYIRI